MLLSIFLTTALMLCFFIWIFISYRKYLINKVEQSSIQLSLLAQEMEAAELESVKYATLQQQLGDAIAEMDLSGARVEDIKERFKQSFPVPEAPKQGESSEVMIKRITDTLRVLDSYSVFLAGLEQGILNVLNIPDSDILLQLLLSTTVGAIPSESLVQTEQIISQLASGNLENLDALRSGASDIVHGLIHLYQTDPHELLSLFTMLNTGQAPSSILGDPQHLAVFSHGFSTVAEHFQGSHYAVDAIHQGAGHLQHLANFHPHFPVITVVLSLAREASLYREGKTDLKTSTKNIALDAVGTGTGGAIGGLVGTLIFPGLGSVLGAVAGGLLGRFLSNKAKEQPLKKAIKLLKEADAAWKSGELEAAYLTAKEMSEIGEEKQKQIILEANLSPRLGESTEQQLIRDAEHLRVTASVYFQQARVNVNLARRYCNSVIGFSVPTLPQLSRQLALVEAKVQSSEDLLPTANLVRTSPVKALEMLSLLPISLPNYENCLKKSLVNAQTVIPPFNRRVAQWYTETVKKWKEVEKEMTETIVAGLNGYKQKCETLLGKVNEAEIEVKHQLDALGYKMKNS